MLEAVVYICMYSIIILIIFSALFLGINAHKRISIKNNLRENSILAEDRIKKELKNASMLRIILSISGENNYLKDGYNKVIKLEYDEIVLKEKIRENRNGELPYTVECKKIEQKYKNLYIGKDGVYQIGNDVDGLYVRKNSMLGKARYDFIIVYKKEKISYKSKFTVVLK